MEVNIATSEIGAGGKDVTEEVVSFYERFGGEESDGLEHIAVVPGLSVVARDGLIKASRKIRELDCKGSHEYDIPMNEASFAVSSLRAIKKYSFTPYGKTAGSIRAVKGAELIVHPDTLDNYRFVVEQEASEKTKQEKALHEYLASGVILASYPARKLVNHDQELTVSAVNPLNSPLTLRRDNGSAALHDANVWKVSAYQEGDKTKLDLVASPGKYMDTNQQISGVNLDEVQFNIKQIERTGGWLISQIEYYHNHPNSGVDPNELIEEFNNLGKTGSAVRFCPEFERSQDTNARTRNFIVASYSDGQLRDFKSKEIGNYLSPSEFALRADKVVIEPESGQLYVINEKTEQAMYLSQVRLI